MLQEWDKEATTIIVTSGIYPVLFIRGLQHMLVCW